MGPQKAGSYKNISQGLDLAGGLSITYQVVGEDNPTPEDMADTIEKLRNKAETYSTEAQVYQEGGNNDRITIEIPGVSDATAILEELGRPGSLYFISQTSPNGDYNYFYELTEDGNYVYVDEKFNKYIYISDDVAVRYDDTTGGALKDENGNVIPYDLNEFESESVSYMLLRSIDDLKAYMESMKEGILAEVREEISKITPSQKPDTSEQSDDIDTNNEGKEGYGIERYHRTGGGGVRGT